MSTEKAVMRSHRAARKSWPGHAPGVILPVVLFLCFAVPAAWSQENPFEPELRIMIEDQWITVNTTAISRAGFLGITYHIPLTDIARWQGYIGDRLLSENEFFVITGHPDKAEAALMHHGPDLVAQKDAGLIIGIVGILGMVGGALTLLDDSPVFWSVLGLAAGSSLAAAGFTMALTAGTENLYNASVAQSALRVYNAQSGTPQ